MEALRLHFGLDRISILAHSYLCTAAILYAARYPDKVSRLILIGPMPPDQSTEYPPDLRSSDGVLEVFQARFAELHSRVAELASADFCQQAWALLRVLYVANAQDADRLHWAACDVPNEVGFMQPFMKYILPSLAALRFTAGTLANLTAPVLLIHGKLDRSSPYGAGRDWARILPNARLLTVDRAAHVPWIEAPALVDASIQLFLAGDWPPEAETVID